MKATAKQVAHSAGVSLSAVSRAFLPGAPLDPEKRKRVLAAAAALGYSSPARRTAEAIASGTVSLVTGDLSNPFYPTLLETLAKGLQEAGQQLLVYTLPGDTTVDTAIPQILAARPKAVVVTSAHLTSSMADACRQHGIRIVLLNRIQNDVRVDAVACNNYAGGRDAAEILIARGRRKISFLGGIATTSTHVERARGFRDRLNEHGIAVHSEANGAFNYQIAFSAAASLLSTAQRPDAIFCCNDLMALATIDAAREMGFALPTDLAVVGFDDIAMASWNSYKLTTIRQPIERMVQETIRLISNAGSDYGDGTSRIIPGKVVLRSSA
ncbi:substrate-binding domain-containing protein [Rhizobium sp. NPDC090275]|uniref:LacI family DNA-binding transcriptional regulator n=1 Tax=Rhizobium sp. NPDC090275 TaxID=3364498 RepID=UPI00383B2A08